MNKILASFLLAAATSTAAELSASKPNIIYLIDDELGYYEPGFMGGKTIHLDDGARRFRIPAHEDFTP